MIDPDADVTAAVEAMRTSVIGTLTGRSIVTVEQAPARRFALAVGDESPVYQDPAFAADRGLEQLPMPPTYAFSALAFWGTRVEDQTDLPRDESTIGESIVDVLGDLLASGGVTLHAEESMRFHRPVLVGDRLHRVGRVVDRFEKMTSKGVLTFVVVENEYRDDAGAIVMTTRTSLVHTRRP